MRQTLWIMGAAALLVGCGSGGGSGTIPDPTTAASVTLSASSISLAAGQTATIVATPRDPSGGALTGRTIAWSSSVPAVASVDNGGVVTAVTVGSTAITATVDGKSASATVTVAAGTPVTSTGGTVATADGKAAVMIPAQAVGQSTLVTIAATSNSTSDSHVISGAIYDYGPSGTIFAQPVTITIKYDTALLGSGVSESQLRVATLSAGTWTPLAGSSVDANNHQVTAQTTHFSTYAAYQVVPPVATIAVVPTSLQLQTGGAPQPLTAVAKDAQGTPIANTTISWTSLVPGVATVSASGLVTAVAAGSGTIRASAGGINSDVPVTVVSPVAVIAVTPLALQFQVGGAAQQLTAVAKDAQGNPLAGAAISWASLTPAVASVSASGLVTALAIGTATIRATAGSITTDVAVTVTPLLWAKISAASNSCAITTTGAGYCWGGFYTGNLPNGSRVFGATRPVPTSGGLKYATLISNGDYTCGLTTAGGISCWGLYNTGNPTSEPDGDPIPIDLAKTFNGLTLTNEAPCATATDGSAWCWGYGIWINIGSDNVDPYEAIPEQVLTAVPLHGIAGATYGACALAADNSLYCWGLLSYGGPSGVNQIAGFPSLTQIAGGNGHFNCALSTAGDAWCIGDNAEGELGNGGLGGPTGPGKVTGGHTFTAITGHGDHTCGLTAAGAAWCWGNNSSGELGDGSAVNRSTPVAVTGGHLFSQLSADQGRTCGVTTDGGAWCWGDNSAGAIGDGTKVNRSLPTRVLDPVAQ